MKVFVASEAFLMPPDYLLKYVEIVPMIIMIQSRTTLKTPGSASIRKNSFPFTYFLE